MPPGRPRKNKSTLPPSYFRSHGAIYHVAKGKWRRVGLSEADAHRDYADRLAQPVHGKLSPLIDAAFDALKARKVDPLAENTIKVYEQAAATLKHLLRAFTDPAQVLPRHAAMIKTGLQGKPNTANHVISFGRIVFNSFLEQELIDSNPFMGVRLFKLAKRTRLIQPDEWDAIYAHAPARLKCIMTLLWLTGQRISDVLKIDERDLLDEGIYIKQKKTGKELIVAWNPELRDAVAACRALRDKVIKLDIMVKGKPRPLLRNRLGRQPAYHRVYAQWVLAAQRAGVTDCRPNDNRAMSATDAQRQGLDAQKLLGHTTPNTTRTYLRGREIDIVQGPQRKKSA